MKTTQDQAAKRLFKKLSALRATLPNDERDILDKLLTEEVSAHRLNLAKNAAKTSTKSTAKSAEVNAHRLNLAKNAAKTSTKSTAKAAEVNAHRLNLAKNAAKTSTKSTAKAARQQIRFNPEIEEYEQIED